MSNLLCLGSHGAKSTSLRSSNSVGGRLTSPPLFVANLFGGEFQRFPSLSKTWLPLDAKPEIIFKDKLRAFMTHNIYLGWYTPLIGNDHEQMVIPKLTLLSPRSIRLAIVAHELVHHAQNGSAAELLWNDTSQNEEIRLTAQAAIEGPAVYCERAYMNYHCTSFEIKIHLCIRRSIEAAFWLLNKALNLFKKDNSEPKPLLSISEVYSLGERLAHILAKDFGNRRMFELLCDHPPSLVSEVRNPQKYLDRLRSDGFIS